MFPARINIVVMLMEGYCTKKAVKKQFYAECTNSIFKIHNRINMLMRLGTARLVIKNIGLE